MLLRLIFDTYNFFLETSVFLLIKLWKQEIEYAFDFTQRVGGFHLICVKRFEIERFAQVPRIECECILSLMAAEEAVVTPICD